MPAFLGNFNTFLTNAGGWVVGLGAGAGGLMLAYHALMRNFTEDPQMVAHHTASIRKVLVGTAIVAGAGAIAAFAGTIL